MTAQRHRKSTADRAACLGIGPCVTWSPVFHVVRVAQLLPSHTPRRACITSTAIDIAKNAVPAIAKGPSFTNISVGSS